jgi:hypothetical protein
LGRAETNAGDPFRVTIRISSNGVLALSKGVPQLNGLIARSGNNLTVVHAESHGKNILSMSNEATSGAPRVDLPQTKGSIPTSRKGELSITRNDHIANKVRMSPQSALSVTVRIVLASIAVGKTPADDGFVAGAGEDEVGVFGGGGDGCYPVAVAAECASERESFGHGLVL